MKFKQTGFTLVELMIVVAVIGVLTVIAVPMYQNQVVRARVTEGLSLAEPAKQAVASESFSVADLKRSAKLWNAQSGGTGANSKYVDSILIDEDTGTITIKYHAENVGISAKENTVTLTPWIRSGVEEGKGEALNSALKAGRHGALDWACTSSRNEVAKDNGIDADLATLQDQYAPAQCR
ncbi:pilin [Neisseria sp. CCUG17229]|uniref:pilin n=1 Tax=Neisseria sp. CCUG17229 TaxID=3392036 RepID=UPI003A102A04